MRTRGDFEKAVCLVPVTWIAGAGRTSTRATLSPTNSPLDGYFHKTRIISGNKFSLSDILKRRFATNSSLNVKGGLKSTLTVKSRPATRGKVFFAKRTHSHNQRCVDYQTD